MEHAEDAGVYRLRADLAIIQTVDFFTPIVDDPYTFGQIAVTNALSDVYAMGGRPLTALNIVCFPIRKMDVKILREILRGGLDKMREAGVLLIGGHSVEDDEPKYGLSVTGVIHPEKVLFNRGAKPGDRLILTKPLGTGIVSTALKGGEADPPALDDTMRRAIEIDRAELAGDFCRGCGYCLPCPAGIPIAQAARMSLLLRRSLVQRFLTDQWKADMAKIGDCQECGHCREQCPYELDTPAILKKMLADYEAFTEDASVPDDLSVRSCPSPARGD